MSVKGKDTEQVIDRGTRAGRIKELGLHNLARLSYDVLGCIPCLDVIDPILYPIPYSLYTIVNRHIVSHIQHCINTS